MLVVFISPPGQRMSSGIAAVGSRLILCHRQDFCHFVLIGRGFSTEAERELKAL